MIGRLTIALEKGVDERVPIAVIDAHGPGRVLAIAFGNKNDTALPHFREQRLAGTMHLDGLKLLMDCASDIGCVHGVVPRSGQHEC